MPPHHKLDESVAARLGDRLRELRLATLDQHGVPLTQERAAHAAGISRNRVQLYEAGLQDRQTRQPLNPALATLMALCEVYGVSVVQLLADVLGESAHPTVDLLVRSTRPSASSRRRASRN